MRKLFGWMAAMGLVLGSSSFASASDYCPPKYKIITVYETVICYETKLEAYKKCETRYDHCGKPYVVEKVCYREVRVPVKKVIAVTKKVPICY